MSNLEKIVNEHFENRSNITPASASQELKDSIEEVITELDSGTMRVAEKKEGEWVVNQWLKKAVMLSFLLEENKVIEGGFTNYYDKVT